MVAALALLLIGFLFHGALSKEFKTFMPQTIDVLSGSCVTIPCSFTIKDEFEPYLGNICRAVWKQKNNNVVVFDSTTSQITRKGELTGNLTKKDCTTTLNNIQPAHSMKYYFRLQCNNPLNYDFYEPILNISVKADPPRPTLTPSTLRVKEGTSVSLRCSAPAPCLSHPPTLTWTPGLGDSQESLQENQDKTKVKISVVNFIASHLHHGKTMSCTAVYSKQDGSTESAVNTSLTVDISFVPKILPSYDCTKAAAQINCSCETVGNPPPTVQWYLDGSPVNHSDKFVTNNEWLSDTGFKSIITVNQPQERDLSTLHCHSSNFLGSTSQRFYVYSLRPQTGQVTLPVFITTVIALFLIVCVLLCVIRCLLRTQKADHNRLKSQCTVDTSTATESQHLTSGEKNEVPNTTGEDIYVNTDALRGADVAHPAAISEANSTDIPSSGPNNAEEARKSSEEKTEEDKDVIYSNVTWKPKSKKKKGEERRSFVSSALEMGSIYDKVEPRNVEKEVESEYAQVKFKDKSDVHT